MLIGYVVGAVGIYTILYKLSPVVADDLVMQSNTPTMNGRVEVIELFPDSSEQRKVA